MLPSVLVLVMTDPRQNPKPAEAIRIVAGVGTWKKVQMILYLHGPAILALDEFVDELVDEDNFVRYLPILSDFPRKVLVEKDSPFISQLSNPTLPFEAVSVRELSQIASSCRNVFHF